jgi:hypothetical protein
MSVYVIKSIRRNHSPFDTTNPPKVEFATLSKEHADSVCDSGNKPVSSTRLYAYDIIELLKP